jgi:hypothetical protein
VDEKSNEFSKNIADKLHYLLRDVYITHRRLLYVNYGGDPRFTDSDKGRLDRLLINKRLSPVLASNLSEFVQLVFAIQFATGSSNSENVAKIFWDSHGVYETCLLIRSCDTEEQRNRLEDLENILETNKTKLSKLRETDPSTRNLVFETVRSYLDAIYNGKVSDEYVINPRVMPYRVIQKFINSQTGMFKRLDIAVQFPMYDEDAQNATLKETKRVLDGVNEFGEIESEQVLPKDIGNIVTSFMDKPRKK